MTPDLFCIAYHSRALLPEDAGARREALSQILASSRRNNAAQNVGGVLMVMRDSFIQVLEGPQRAVQQAFDRIAADDRHEDLAILHMGFVAAPSFTEWSMGLVADASLEPDLAARLAAEEGGVEAIPVTADRLLGFFLDLMLRELGRSPARRLAG